MADRLPAGTVTFLFTDVEGSTKLLHEVGADAYAQLLLDHRTLLRQAFGSHGGVEVDTQGDAFFVAFPTAGGAVAAAQAAQAALAAGGPIRVRMGLHTGRPVLIDRGYVGADVHLGARIAAAGHGGQVLLSKATAAECSGEVSDLGEHRLKDFADPVWIFQLGRERFPPLKTVSNTNLPRPASAFVGREREVHEVTSLLRDGARLVSLTGPGGSGKTRLSIESAADLVPDFRNGVFWVPLAALRDPALVLETAARTLGAKGDLAEHVGERELLLVLDNFEQVVPAATELVGLLESCANLRVLVSSRQRLRVRGEVEYSVPPLTEEEAVRLFCQRAQLPDSSAIADLCARLDRLPLALELAASRTSVLTPEQIVERLAKRLDMLRGGRDAEARQQTLRATIEWSHDLLNEDERQLFARLAVFAGGCTLSASEEVCDADLDVLESLVDKSLVRHTGDRFSMLETIREFAAEQLASSDQASKVRERFGAWCLALAEAAEPHLHEDSPEWADRVERENDNLRAGFEGFATTGPRASMVRAAGAIYRFWYLKSHLAEGQRCLDAALELNPEPSVARAKALIGASVMALNLRQLDISLLRAEQALELSQRLDYRWGVAYATMMVGNSHAESGDLEPSLPLFEEAIQRFRDLDESHYVLVTSINLAWVTDELGDHDKARALFEDVLRQARAGGKSWMTFAALGQLGMMERDAGNLDAAASMLREAIALQHASGAIQQLAVDVARLASILVRLGQGSPAAVLVAASDALTESLEASVPWWAERRNQETRQMIRGLISESAFLEATEEGRRLTVDEVVECAVGRPAASA